jgi:hypothetical protein
MRALRRWLLLLGVYRKWLAPSTTTIEEEDHPLSDLCGHDGFGRHWSDPLETLVLHEGIGANG